jgi:hypothetical protein
LQKYTVIQISLAAVVAAILAWLVIGFPFESAFKQVVPERKIEYVQPVFHNGSDAVVILSKDQGLGGVVVNRVYSDQVEIDFHSGAFGRDDVRTVLMQMGDSISGICAGEATLVNITPGKDATFNYTAGGYCPICYHIYKARLLYHADGGIEAIQYQLSIGQHLLAGTN